MRLQGGWLVTIANVYSYTVTEVRLAEALERCGLVAPSVEEWGDEELEGHPRPNRLRTAVCCQVRGTFDARCC